MGQYGFRQLDLISIMHITSPENRIIGCSLHLTIAPHLSAHGAELQKYIFLHYQGLGQSQFTRENRVNYQEKC